MIMEIGLLPWNSWEIVNGKNFRGQPQWRLQYWFLQCRKNLVFCKLLSWIDDCEWICVPMIFEKKNIKMVFFSRFCGGFRRFNPLPRFGIIWSHAFQTHCLGWASYDAMGCKGSPLVWHHMMPPLNNINNVISIGQKLSQYFSLVFLPSTNGSVVKFSILLCLCSALSSTESGYMKKVWYKLAKR